MAWHALRRQTFAGIDAQAGDQILAEGEPWPCDMAIRAKQHAVIEVPLGCELKRNPRSGRFYVVDPLVGDVEPVRAKLPTVDEMLAKRNARVKATEEAETGPEFSPITDPAVWRAGVEAQQDTEPEPTEPPPAVSGTEPEQNPKPQKRKTRRRRGK